MMMKNNNIGQMRNWVSQFPLSRPQPLLVTRRCFPFPPPSICTNNRSSPFRRHPCPTFLPSASSAPIPTLSSSLTSPPNPLMGIKDDGLVGYLSGNKKATQLAHVIWKNVIRKGDIAIDATCGNGYDTLAMVKLVADESGRGSVYGFDIQREAIDNTSSLLNENLNAKEREFVKLYHMCHSRMDEIVPENGPVRLVAFNLGYLPGGDKTVTTLPETTLLALESAKKILVSGGLISLVVYVGHPGGREELQKVEAFTCGLGVEDWVCSKFQMLNRPLAPVLVLLFKR